MLHPEEVRLKVRQGEIPDNWRVLRGNGWLAFRRVSIVWLLLVVGSTINTWMQVPLQNIGFSYIWPPITMLLILCGITAAICLGIIRHSTLVYMPQGCVQFTPLSLNRALWYDSIADMQLNNNLWLFKSLTIRYHDGTRSRWCPNAPYGFHSRIVEDILSDYRQYSATRLSMAQQAFRDAYTYYPL
jgi:hypothetical protein